MYTVSDIVNLRKEMEEGFVESLTILLADVYPQKAIVAAVARLEREIAAVSGAAVTATRRDVLISLERTLKANWP